MRVYIWIKTKGSRRYPSQKLHTAECKVAFCRIYLHGRDYVKGFDIETQPRINFSRSYERVDVKLIKKQTYTKTEACKRYSRVFCIFLPNVIKIDPYNFELYCFKVVAFLRHSVVLKRRSEYSLARIIKIVSQIFCLRWVVQCTTITLQ